MYVTVIYAMRRCDGDLRLPQQQLNNNKAKCAYSEFARPEIMSQRWYTDVGVFKKFAMPAAFRLGRMLYFNKCGNRAPDS